MTHASWGPDVVEAECRQALEKEGISPRRLEEGELCRKAAEAHPDPFMLFTTPVSRAWASRIPSALHVDGTGRLQAVTREANPLFWQRIGEFQQRTQVPVLRNTSFNEQEPIVCRPEEALACFRRNGIDALALGPFWV